MDARNLETLLSQFVECFRLRWAEVLPQPNQVIVSESQLPDLGAQPTWLKLTFAQGFTGDAAVVVPGSATELLTGSQGGNGQPSEPADTAGTAGANYEIVRRVLASALQDFQSKYMPLVARIEPSQSPEWTATKTLAFGSDGSVSLCFLASPELKLADVGSQVKGARAENLDRVMDAPLDVTLRFGQRRLTLSALAALGPGSVVELDRRVQQPVELILDGKVLAAGEVVIVDGNYGLRVTELFDRR